MSKLQARHKLESLGYYLLPPRHPWSPGHEGLLVLLRAEPQPVDFDPASIQLKVLGWDGKSVRRTSFQWNTPFPSTRSVCPGKVVIQDSSGHEADFFVFGGTLAGIVQPGEAIYSLHSSAPILHLIDRADSVDGQLAIEVEGLLAEEQARQRWEDQTFWQRLLTVDPFQLYTSCLDAILNRYDQTAALRQTHYHYYLGLRKEKERLEQIKRWPAPALTLAELLT